ncbi:hypothetical protein AB0P40_14390, partial [Streptomyces sp. NPDC079189]
AAFGPEQINRLDESLTAAGVRLHSETCTPAHRGFAQAGTAACDSTADQRPWTAPSDRHAFKSRPLSHGHTVGKGTAVARSFCARPASRRPSNDRIGTHV